MENIDMNPMEDLTIIFKKLNVENHFRLLQYAQSFLALEKSGRKIPPYSAVCILMPEKESDTQLQSLPKKVKKKFKKPGNRKCGQ